MGGKDVEDWSKEIERGEGGERERKRKKGLFLFL